VSVGWDKRIRIWKDLKNDNNEDASGADIVRIQKNRDWPQYDKKSTLKKEMHMDDIMTCCYYNENNNRILFTGGHDGTLYGWNFETGTIRYRLHEWDKECKCLPGADPIKAQKSIDCLMVMRKRGVLLSGTADQKIRFWCLKNMPQAPLLVLYTDHGPGESLTALNSTTDNRYLVTGDTSGQMKCWHIHNLELRAKVPGTE